MRGEWGAEHVAGEEHQLPSVRILITATYYSERVDVDSRQLWKLK